MFAKAKRIYYNCEKYAPMALLFLSVAVRLSFLSVFGIKLGGDSGEYIQWSCAFAKGDLSPLRQYPFHQIYSIVLAPMHWLPMSMTFYVSILHVILSSVTVLLIYLIAKRLVSKNYGFLIGAFAIFYPSFLFWLPYVLTETFFLFVMSFQIFILFVVLNEINVKNVCFFLISCILIFFTRPTGLPIIIVSIFMIMIKILKEKFGCFKSYVIASSLVMFFIVGSVGILYRNNSIRNKLIGIPTVSQSLWLSVNLVTNDMKETKNVWRKDKEIVKKYNSEGYSPKEIRQKKSLDALNFINKHPIDYLKRVFKRFFAFWFPWIFASTWSKSHIIVDFIISITLTLGTLFMLFDEKMWKLETFALVFMALGLSVLTAFSQIDTDGRYRLPAELLLLIIAPYGWIYLIDYVIKVYKRR